MDSFPHALLEIKDIKPLSDEKSKLNTEILADLTIRGKTNEISEAKRKIRNKKKFGVRK